jgi:hypothetical protein
MVNDCPVSRRSAGELRRRVGRALTDAAVGLLRGEAVADQAGGIAQDDHDSDGDGGEEPTIRSQSQVATIVCPGSTT